MPVRVDVSPDVLGWALDRARDPDTITASTPNVLKWISGETRPTVKQLAEFAARTGTPFGYLLLPRPPDLALPVQDFREGFDGRPLGDPSPELLAVVHQSIRRQDWYREYAVENGLPEVDVVGSAEGASPVEAAADMRQALGYEVARRRGDWSEQRRHLLRAFEDLGGLTVATSMVGNNTSRLLDADEFRGFSLVDPLAPLVFVNTGQTLNGQIFTLAHEFAHVWRGVGGVSLEDVRWRPRSPVERWCNDVAAEFLVPAADLRARYDDVRDLELEDQLERLARTYRCGTLVVLQAINRNGLRHFDDYAQTYDAEVERLTRIAADRGGGGNGDFWKGQPSRIGERFSRALIGDALGGRTTLGEAVRLLSLGSLKNFNRYARQLHQVDA